MVCLRNYFLLISFVFVIAISNIEAATDNAAAAPQPSEKASVTTSGENIQKNAACAEKKITKKRSKKTAAYRTTRSKVSRTRTCRTTRNSASRNYRPLYARSLAELQGPLPEIISTELCRLRDTHHLLNTDDISIHIHDLSKNETVVNIKADRMRNAASLIKPFVMLTVYDQAQQNKICLTDSMENQIYKMITISHIESTNSLIRQIGNGSTYKGLEQINTTIKKYGFRDTYLVEPIPEGGRTYRNRTSAYDMSEFFRKVYSRTLVSPYYSQKMVDILLNNKVHRIETPTLKQDGVPVADKTGYVRGTNGDCGIVFLRNIKHNASDYVVSIIIENPYRPQEGWGKQKTAVIRHLSNLIYSYFRQRV
jgi:beta-lactamase class A